MIGIVLVCIAATLWGTVGVANSLMVSRDAVDPALAGMVRTSLGAISLLAAAELMGLSWRGARPQLRLLALFGVAGAVFQFCLFAAYVQVGVTVTVAVTVCAPVVLVVTGEAAWRRAWPEPGAMVAIGMATFGVVLAMAAGAPSVGSASNVHWHGVALLATGSAAYAIVAALARVIARELHPLRATGLGLAITAASLAAVVLAAPGTDTAVLTRLPLPDLAILAYTGIAATGGAYFALVLGLRLSRTTASGLTATLVEPGVAAVLAALVLLISAEN